MGEHDEFTIIWTCKKCQGLNLDDYLRTAQPMCYECSEVYDWAEVTDNKSITEANKALHKFIADDLDVYRSDKDGTIVVHVDTPNLPEDMDGPVIRVYLNDEAIHENPSCPGEDNDG